MTSNKIIELKKKIDDNNITSMSDILDLIYKENDYECYQIFVDSDLFDLFNVYIEYKRHDKNRKLIKAYFQNNGFINE